MTNNGTSINPIKAIAFLFPSQCVALIRLMMHLVHLATQLESSCNDLISLCPSSHHHLLGPFLASQQMRERKTTLCVAAAGQLFQMTLTIPQQSVHPRISTVHTATTATHPWPDVVRHLNEMIDISTQ